MRIRCCWGGGSGWGGGGVVTVPYLERGEWVFWSQQAPVEGSQVLIRQNVISCTRKLFKSRFLNEGGGEVGGGGGEVGGLTQQSSEARQVLRLQPQLPGGLTQQVLVRGQVLAVPAQLERVRGEVRRNVAEGELGVLSDQAGEAEVPVEGQHLLVVVLQSLNHLSKQSHQQG